MVGVDAFIEANAHAKARADVNDSGEKFDFLAFVGELYADDRAAGSGIECIDVAAGAADVAGAGGKPRSGGRAKRSCDSGARSRTRRWHC